MPHRSKIAQLVVDWFISSHRYLRSPSYVRGWTLPHCFRSFKWRTRDFNTLHGCAVIITAVLDIEREVNLCGNAKYYKWILFRRDLHQRDLCFTDFPKSCSVIFRIINFPITFGRLLIGGCVFNERLSGVSELTACGPRTKEVRSLLLSRFLSCTNITPPLWTQSRFLEPRFSDLPITRTKSLVSLEFAPLTSRVLHFDFSNQFSFVLGAREIDTPRIV